MLPYRSLKIPKSDYQNCATDFEKNVILHIDKIYLLSFLMRNSKRQAWNLTKTVFIKAFQFYPMLDDRINREDWLFRIWVKHYQDKFRNGGRFFKTDRDSEDSPSALKSCEVLSMKHISAIMFSLPEFNRISLIFNDVLQKSNSQIASYTGYPAEIASAAANEALTMLRGKSTEADKFLIDKLNSISAPKRLKKLIAERTIRKFNFPKY